jgi:peptidoglycan pentaglycine glycine transferase (the first glycine)
MGIENSVVNDSTSQWDSFVNAHNGHILQTAAWGRLKRAFGWQDQVVRTDAGGALILYKALPMHVPGSLAYVPRGPVVDWDNELAVRNVLMEIDRAAKAHRAFALKIEPDLPDTPEIRAKLESYGLRPSPQVVQPPRTILIDITGSEDDILMRMSQTTRRKVRTGAKKGIEVRQGDASDLGSFNALMNITGSRNEFGVHSAEYYRMAYELFAPEHAAILFASHEGKDLATLMIFACGETAWYFYGASSNEERERMPTYALQWEAIRWAREKGCKVYDLWGIPDEDEATLEAQFQSRNDGLWGVYGFKRGFGGEVWRSVGAWDRVYNPIMYRIYELAMKSRGLHE